MTDNKDYARGYSKGRATGKRMQEDALALLRARAAHAAQRAERAEQKNGIGHCEDCAFWLRGGGGPNGPICSWGICKAPPSEGTPFGTWMVADTSFPNISKIQTTPHFGCVLFMGKKATAEPPL